MRALASLITVMVVAFLGQGIVALAGLEGAAMWSVYLATMITAAVAGFVIAPPARRSGAQRHTNPPRPHGA